MAFPALVDSAARRIISTIDKYPDARDLNLARWVRDTFRCPLALDNDANAALAGEWQFGAGRGCRSLVLVTIGTGVGTSAIINGEPLRGEHGQAGCLGGHLVVNTGGRRCVCGNEGCVEAEASTWALPAIAREHAGFAGSALSREPHLTYETLFRVAAAGDPVAAELRDRGARVWAAAIVSLIHAYDPEIVILTGGVMKGGQFLLPFIQQHVNSHAWTGWGNPRIVAGQLGDDAALLGMDYLLRRQLGNE